jgi:RNA polymerase sigma-70 factor, ECF subfamily
MPTERTEPKTDAPPTSAVVRAVHEGDRARFQELYQRLAPALIAWADIRIPTNLRMSLEPEDVAQEVWCRALRSFQGFDPAVTPFRAWLFTIAGNVLLEGFRRTRRHPRSPRTVTESSKVFDLEAVPADATSITRRAARDEDLARFIARVSTLAAEDRRLLVYRGLEALPHQDVARRLGITADSAMKRWQRLRAELERDCRLRDLFD